MVAAEPLAEARIGIGLQAARRLGIGPLDGEGT
jgi:hypothetical protein